MAILTVGIDLAKNVFAVHGVNETGAVALRQPKVARRKLNALMVSLPPCVIGIEACSGANYWARQFQAHGHTVRLMAPKHSSPHLAQNIRRIRHRAGGSAPRTPWSIAARSIKARKKRGRARNAPKFDLRTQLFQMCGVDLMRIDGVDVTTALAVVSEVGADMSKFPTVKHFTSWLGLCPGTKITGGRVMSGKTARVVNRAAQALRLAAPALRSSKSALGAYFRRLCSRMDKPKAVTAAAHKIARLIYTLLTRGQEYTDQRQDYYEERYRERVLGALSQRAAKLGMQMVPIAPAEQPA